MPTGPKGSISSPRWSTRGLRTRKSAPGQGRLTRIYVEFLNRFSQMNVLFWRFECSDKTDTITNKHYNSKSIQTLRSGSFSTIRDQQRHQKTDFGRIFRTQAIWSFSGGGSDASDRNFCALQILSRISYFLETSEPKQLLFPSPVWKQSESSEGDW